MTKQLLLFLIFISVYTSSVFCQKTKFSYGIWNQETINGQFTLEGLYRSQKTVLKSEFTEQHNVKDFLGKIILKSQSNLWHPNFMQLNINAKYNPGTKRENFLVMPNRSEVKTAESIHLQSIFFKERPLSFTLFSNFDHTYINREFTTNVKMLRKDFGGNLSFKNKKLPATLSYLNSDWEQKEIQTGRVFENYRHNLRTQIDKTFGKKSRHSLSYSYDDYTRSYANNASTKNKTSNINLRDVFNFNKNGNRFTSQINYYNQNGSKDFKRLQINENIGISLPKHFKFHSKYHFTNYKQSQNETNQHNFINKLEHQLFSSLKSQVFYEYFKLDRSAYNEKKQSAGLNLNYSKIIPYGNLYLSYNYKNRNEQRESRPLILTIFNEEQVLTDGNTTLLDNPYIDIESIVVTDETGTIIYSKDIDYLLIERGDYIEIQRLSGGQIPNGTIVYTDYIVSKQTSYEFNMASNNINIRLNL
ncbi:MAG: hypothetical protein KAR38_08005, partial [Calditrichia bacterium]|nr:hypothetical protein [Calditrichia bacterium]